MNALVKFIDKENQQQNPPPLEELWLFCGYLGTMKKEVLEAGSSNNILTSDINTCYTVTMAIENLNIIVSTLHVDSNITHDAWEYIFKQIDIIVDGYSELKINTSILNEALRNLKVYHSIENTGIRDTGNNVIRIEDHRNKLANQKQRYDALEGVVFSEEGFSSLQAQDRVLQKLQRVIQKGSANQSDIGRIQSDIDSLQHMYRNFDPRWESREELLQDIMAADITKNADLAQRISMFIRVRSAGKRNYTATQEASPMLERHLDNLRERHPIIINTLEYGNVAITHIKKMYYEGAQGEYYKVRTQDKNGRKKDILLRTDNAVVGDLSRKYLGEFDSQGKFVSTNNTFTILSIQSDKIQHKRVEPTLTHKVSKTLSSIKNSVLGMFKKKE